MTEQLRNIMVISTVKWLEAIPSSVDTGTTKIDQVLNTIAEEEKHKSAPVPTARTCRIVSFCGLGASSETCFSSSACAVASHVPALSFLTLSIRHSLEGRGRTPWFAPNRSKYTPPRFAEAGKPPEVRAIRVSSCSRNGMLCYYARYARLTEDGEAACPREAHHLPDGGAVLRKATMMERAQRARALWRGRMPCLRRGRLCCVAHRTMSPHGGQDFLREVWQPLLYDRQAR